MAEEINHFKIMYKLQKRYTLTDRAEREYAEENIRKTCSGCSILKPLGKFHKNRRCKYGYLSECKKCRSLRMKAKYMEQKESE